jgi:hypothetical protein
MPTTTDQLDRAFLGSFVFPEPEELYPGVG